MKIHISSEVKHNILTANRIAEVLNIKKLDPVYIKIDTAEYIIFTHNKMCNLWKLHDYKNYFFTKKQWIENKLTPDEEVAHIKLYLQPTAEIESNKNELVNIKWNNVLPYIYSSQLVEDIIVVFYSNFSNTIAFARNLYDNKLQHFVKRFYEKEKHYREEYRSFVGKLDVEEIGILESRVPAIELSISVHHLNDYNTQKYLKDLRNIITEYVNTEDMIPKTEQVLDITEIKPNAVYIHPDKHCLMTQKKLSQAGYNKMYSIENVIEWHLFDDDNTVAMYNPPDSVSYKLKGNVLFKCAEYQAAIKLYNVAISLNPQDTDLYVAKSECLKALGQYQEAQKCSAILQALEKGEDISSLIKNLNTEDNNPPDNDQDKESDPQNTNKSLNESQKPNPSLSHQIEHGEKSKSDSYQDYHVNLSGSQQNEPDIW